MADSIETRLIVKAITEGFDQVSKDLKKPGQAAEETEKKVGGLGNAVNKLGGILKGVAGAAAGFGLTMKKAFDFGRELAAVQQTGQSFDIFLRQVGASPDLLDKLRAASKGTVGDMTLMSSTMTLAAGANKELANQLINATPQLLEIAKAANKLNPSLGDTTFLYDSIATGVKRASPLILDNLGLTIKVGKANEDYAAQLGKSTDALTANEQKQALLQATLKAGETLIQQAGGTTDSATDSFDKLSASLDNLKIVAAGFEIGGRTITEWLTRAAQAATAIIQGIQDLNAAIDEQGRQLVASTNGYDEYLAAVNQHNEAMGILPGHIKAVTEAEYEAAKGTNDATKAIDAWGKRLQGAADAASKGAEDISGAMDDSADSAGNADAKIGALSDAISRWGQTALANSVLVGMWNDAIKLGGISPEELQRMHDFANAVGIELPPQLDTAVSNFNALHDGGEDAYTVLMGIKTDLLDKDIKGLWHLTIQVDSQGGGGGGGGGPSINELRGSGSSGGSQQAAGGPGAWKQGKWTMVGEQGFELVDPSGYVHPHGESMRIVQSGQVRFNRKAMGGQVESGGNIYLPPINPDPYGGTGNAGDPYSGGGGSQHVNLGGGGGGGGGGSTSPTSTSTSSTSQATAQQTATVVEQTVTTSVAHVVSALLREQGSKAAIQAARAEHNQMVTNRLLNQAVAGINRLLTSDQAPKAFQQGAQSIVQER